MSSNLRQYRESRGLSVDEVSTLAEIKAQTYYKYEAGTRFPSRKKMIRLAAVLGTSVEKIFFTDTVDHKSNKAKESI